MENILVTLVKGGVPTNKQIEQELLETCLRENASCNDNCPVYRINKHKVPRAGDVVCICLKDGHAMRQFIASMQTAPAMPTANEPAAIDFTPATVIATNLMNQLEAGNKKAVETFKPKIFESVMELIYGNQVWDWINTKL